MLSNTDIQQFMAKVKKAEDGHLLDLSSDEDLSIAIMNLVSIEEHLFFTGNKTNKTKYFDLLNQAREMRKELLAKVIPRTEGETWCAAKHLLATAMRLMEVGTKLQGEKKSAEAQEFFHRAYKMYSLFWGLRLKLINSSDFKKIAMEEKPWSFRDIVDKLVDCCDEK